MRLPSRPSIALALLLALGSAVAPGSAADPPAELDDARVGRAIAALVDGLLARKHASHFWEPTPWNDRRDGPVSQAGGYTALCVLALHHAGISHQDPRIADAVAWLAEQEMPGTYALAVRTILWSRLPPKYAPNLEADARRLAAAFVPNVAGWGYVAEPERARRDNSLRQFGALALWAAARRGVAVDDRLWAALEQATVAAQRGDGGWNYQCDDEPPRGSMTAASLATLHLTEDRIRRHDRVRLERRRRVEPWERAAAEGLAWLDVHYSPVENPGSQRSYFYYAYALERVGLAAGVARFDGRDWFRETGAEILRRLVDETDPARPVVHQRQGGAARGAEIRDDEIAFALLFLTRGRVPIAVQKLAVPDFGWNDRPRDAAAIAEIVGAATESEANWRIVSIDDPPEEMLAGAFLLLTGAEPLPFVQSRRAELAAWSRERDAAVRTGRPVPAAPEVPEAASLHAALERGAMLLAVQAGGGGFARSVESLADALFPSATWRTLDADDALFTALERVRRAPRARALSNGVRDLVVLVESGDPAAAWQAGAGTSADADALAVNAFLLASERDRARPRLARPAPVAPPPAPDDAPRIARLRPRTAPPAEPRALDAFAAWSAARGRPVRVLDVDLADADPAADVALWVLSGVDAWTPAPDEAAALTRLALDARGLLLVESAGGRGAFAESVETRLAGVPGLAPILVARHAMTTGVGDDGTPWPGVEDASRCAYRPAALDRFGGRETAPRLRGLARDGALRVVLSREDLAHALLDRPWLGVVGYETEDARRIVANLLAVTGRAAPADTTPAP